MALTPLQRRRRMNMLMAYAALSGSKRLGPELITNGLFPENASGWTPVNSTLSAPAGLLVITADGGTAARATQAFPTTPGRTYEVSFTVRLISGSSPTGAFIQTVGTSSAYTTSASDVARTFTFVAAASSTTLVLDMSGTTVAATEAEFDNVSVRQLAIHGE